MTGAVQLNQLIFDGSYLIGLKAVREMQNRSEKELEQARLEARVQAAKACRGCWPRKVPDCSAKAFPWYRSASEAAAMTERGLMETTDADRLTVQVDETENQRRTLLQQAAVARARAGGGPAHGHPDPSSPIPCNRCWMSPTDADQINRPFDPAQHGGREVARVRHNGRTQRSQQEGRLPPAAIRLHQLPQQFQLHDLSRTATFGSGEHVGPATERAHLQQRHAQEPSEAGQHRPRAGPGATEGHRATVVDGPPVSRPY